MTTVTPKRSFLRVADLEPSELDGLIDLAAAMREDPLGRRDGLEGGTLACYAANWMPTEQAVLRALNTGEWRAVA